MNRQLPTAAVSMECTPQKKVSGNMEIAPGVLQMLATSRTTLKILEQYEKSMHWHYDNSCFIMQ